jgi:hypothetical protein
MARTKAMSMTAIIVMGALMRSKVGNVQASFPDDHTEWSCEQLSTKGQQNLALVLHLKVS